MGLGAGLKPRRRYHAAVIASIPLGLAVGYGLMALLGPRTTAFSWSIVALIAVLLLVLGVYERRTRG